MTSVRNITLYVVYLVFFVCFCSCAVAENEPKEEEAPKESPDVQVCFRISHNLNLMRLIRYANFGVNVSPIFIYLLCNSYNNCGYILQFLYEIFFYVIEGEDSRNSIRSRNRRFGLLECVCCLDICYFGI